MRILFLNTEDIHGGAAIVLQRLAKGLQVTHKTDNLVLVKNKSGEDLHTQAILKNSFQIVSEKIVDRITRKTGLLYQYFPFSSPKILEIAKSFKPDVINLHNTHSGYFATPLVERLSQIAPVVWTLHDMWSFTGNAAHTFGNLSWKSLQNDAHLTRVPPSIGLNTGGWLLRQKKNIYKRSNLTIVTPSEWLRGLAEQSPVFEGKKIVRIYNGINPEVFKPGNKPECKRIMGFAPDSKVVMFSAEYLNKNNPWKGGTDLLEILSRMNKSVKGKINLLVLGKSKPKEIDNFSNFDVHYKGYVSNEREMCNYLNASDLFIYPTRADNLPNVLVESIASGTPCITFNVGGNSEIIIDGENGIVVEPFNFDDFARKALTLLDEEERLAEYSEKGLGLVRKRFQLKEMIDQYYQVFDEVKKKN